LSVALAQWWGNPVTAALIAVALLVPLLFTLSGLIAIVRLGNIQLGGLLAQRTSLLPGYPRRFDAYASLIVFLQVGMGVLLVLFSLAVVRAGRLVGASNTGLLTILVLVWILAIVISVGIARGGRVEPMALVTLVALRPWTGLLRRFAVVESADDDGDAEDEEEIDEHEVQAFIGAGEDAGILEREDAELIASIVELSDTVAREIMTPRTDVVALPMSSDFATLQKKFAESMFTRIAVFRDTLDRIEGVVHVKDVLRAVVSGTTPAVKDLLRLVLVVPETKPLRELLREFQTSRQQFAVVVDEYGGTSGIVTLEDVLEEIVGEIRDEHERETPEVQKESDGTYLLKGSTNVDALEDLFGVEVGEVGFDSVAGLVLDCLGHMPRVGEHAAWRGLDLEVVEVDRRRLRRVRARRAP
jgi:CBS domain containing-hemolysin-like protein